jgi:hypothetical protein
MPSPGPRNPSKLEKAILRTTDRVKLKISIAYSFETSPQPKHKSIPFRWGMLLDIGACGLCFKATDHFFVQHLLMLQLKLSDQTSGIRILGKIIWTAPEDDGSTRVGVQFIGTLPSDWRKLLSADRDGDGESTG